PDVNSPSQRGDAVAEINAYLKTGIDGFFTDDPAVGRAAVNAFK
ncbi:MAG TPA: glycerophosphodiester phosphodiesterase, partial [Telluria sp.]